LFQPVQVQPESTTYVTSPTNLLFSDYYPLALWWGLRTGILACDLPIDTAFGESHRDPTLLGILTSENPRRK
jgi:hypothetical protein